MLAKTDTRPHECPPPPSDGSLYVRTLHRACIEVGGIGPLAKALGVPRRAVMSWLDGEEPPMDIFLRAVDLIGAHRG
jgi:hypothetical protein